MSKHVEITKSPDGSTSIVTSDGDGSSSTSAGSSSPSALTISDGTGHALGLRPELNQDIPFNVVLIAVLGMVFVLVIVFGGMRHEHKKLALKAAARTPPDDGWRTNVEQRLATLERIVTDTGTPLAYQIEALRTDARPTTRPHA